MHCHELWRVFYAEGFQIWQLQLKIMSSQSSFMKWQVKPKYASVAILVLTSVVRHIMELQNKASLVR